jgi:hypothetical protein
MNKIILIGLVVFCILGCNRYSDDVNSTISIAGENKSELKKVLDHYKKIPGDSLKYKAACFLIENMKWHFSTRVTNTDDFWNAFLIEDSLSKDELSINNWKSEWASKGYKYVAKKIVIKSGLKKIIRDESYNCDATFIDANFLINTIEGAFNIWNQPNVKKLSFNEFCEYILAYRFNNEPVFDLRLKLQEHFRKVLNTDSLHENPNKTISSVNKYLNNFYWDWYDLDAKFPDLGFYNIFYWNINDMHCYNHVAIEGQILRAMGIPITEVFTSKWNDANTGHSWIGLLDNKNKITLFSPIYQDPGSEEDRFRLSLATKFFIKTFAAQSNTPYFLKSEKETLPGIFASPCIKDITSDLVKTSNVELSVSSPPQSNNLAYFCAFINGSWDPIGWGIINHQKQTAKFEQLPIDLIGLPCIWDGNVMNPIGPLVQIKPDGQSIPIKPSNKTETLTLYRKFPYKARMQYFAGKIIGTSIEGANKSDFSDASTLGTIKDTLIPYMQDYSFNNSRAFRYYRLISPGYNLYIAELEFLTKQKQYAASEATSLPVFKLDKIKPEVFYKIKGTPMSSNSEDKAFDGNILTFTDAKWVGIDLGTPKLINKIRLIPRNSNNGIVVRNSYELLFWDNKWVSLGEKQAQYNYLEFNNVPLGTFYWLKNNTEGREEQPFLYENDEQLFINNKFPFKFKR